MPKHRRNAYGVICSTLTIELIRTIVRVILEESDAAALADEALLCAALSIGQAEGRPMSASKIASYVGLPRPTAIRKMQRLHALGILAQDADKSWRFASHQQHIDDRISTAVAVNLRHIRKAARAVSKLDNSPVAKNSQHK